ncbi:GAF domain-containing protein [Halomonas sp. BM-2019]|uniref:GAF domain-containing protein n=1 Tax=Halomonas sp. BM-2019 TaxID=2811227 RepID=UPI001B3C3009|nr:MAG: GAF domain-containing protein [Halomonas sp. BM-2019]
MTNTRGFIEQCEREALHLSGAIQPHGALLVVGPDGRVTHASRNLEALLGFCPEDLLGQALSLPLAKPLRRLEPLAGARLTVAHLDGLRTDLAMQASRNASGQVILELLQPGDVSEPPLDAIPPPMVAIHSDDELDERRQALVERIAALSGFDRVLFYRFLPNGDGEVLVEALGEGARGRYLGLRFPASDVPQVARALYVQNPWRSIPDAAAESVPLVGQGGSPPDLSLADLRSLSPVHRLYLHNMGVAAAVSFPLAIGGELTALISCHAASPRRLSLPMLELLSRDVVAHGLAEKEYRARTRLALLAGFERRFSGLRVGKAAPGGLRRAWPELGRWLMAEFEADGAMLCRDGEALGEGLSLEPEALSAVERWCEGDGVITRISDHLVGDCPDMPLSEVSGLLAISVLTRDGERLRCYLCRGEVVQEVAWGGNPDKPAELHSGPIPLAPRRSFETWVETRLGHSRPWTDRDRLKLLKLRLLLQSTAL